MRFARPRTLQTGQRLEREAMALDRREMSRHQDLERDVLGRGLIVRRKVFVADEIRNHLDGRPADACLGHQPVADCARVHDNRVPQVLQQGIQPALEGRVVDPMQRGDHGHPHKPPRHSRRHTRSERVPLEEVETLARRQPSEPQDCRETGAHALVGEMRRPDRNVGGTERSDKALVELAKDGDAVVVPGLTQAARDLQRHLLRPSGHELADYVENPHALLPASSRQPST